MSVGGLFLVVGFVLFFLEGIGMRTIPGAGSFAHACVCLGLLLGALPFGPWWRSGPP
jgi:hypothetical protein